MANIKAHLLAVTVVAIVVVAAMMLFNPSDKKQDGNADEDSYFIQIYSASYGVNCDGSTEYKPPNKSGVREKIKLSFKRNNRLGRVSELCNEESSCVFKVGASMLGSLESYDCDPSLEVKYRCFRIDKIQTTHLMEGEKVKIDCRPDTVKKRISGVSAKESQ